MSKKENKVKNRLGKIVAIAVSVGLIIKELMKQKRSNSNA